MTIDPPVTFTVVPDGAKVIGTWYRALGPDGEMLGDSSDWESLVTVVAGTDGVTFQRMNVYRIEGPWLEWQPPPRSAFGVADDPRCGDPYNCTCNHGCDIP